MVALLEEEEEEKKVCFELIFLECKENTRSQEDAGRHTHTNKRGQQQQHQHSLPPNPLIDKDIVQAWWTTTSRGITLGW